MSTNQRVGKALSYFLRHRRDAVDEHGWATVADLCARTDVSVTFTPETIMNAVATDQKSRFEVSEDGMRVRAVQGHSIDVDAGAEQAVPPTYLYHGTPVHFLDSVLDTGLDRRERQHVHLSADQETARKVGQRRGVPALVRIDAQRMHDDGHVFLLAKNGVWLTDHVPSRYIFRAIKEA